MLFGSHIPPRPGGCQEPPPHHSPPPCGVSGKLEQENHHHRACLSPTLCSRQPRLGHLLSTCCFLLQPTEHFVQDPPELSILCFLLSTSWEERGTLPPPSPQSCLLHTTGKDWSYMEKLVMKAVLGNSTSKVASLDSLARLTILLVTTVWANRDVTLQSTWRL